MIRLRERTLTWIFFQISAKSCLGYKLLQTKPQHMTDRECLIVTHLKIQIWQENLSSFLLQGAPYQDFGMQKGRTFQHLKFPNMIKFISQVTFFCCLTAFILHLTGVKWLGNV